MAMPEPNVEADQEALPEIAPAIPAKKRAWLSPLNQRRWRNFRRNRRAFWSLIIFAVLFGLSLFAEFIANNKPIIVKHNGEYYMPIFKFYPETAFGGDLPIEAQYQYEDIACLIVSGGVIDCYDDPEGILAEIDENGTALGEPVDKGWLIWPIIPYRFDTIVDIQGAAPSPPDSNNWLGTDDTKRDVMARVIYALRDHHHVRDFRAKFLDAGIPDRAFRLAGTGGRGPGRVPAGAKF